MGRFDRTAGDWNVRMTGFAGTRRGDGGGTVGTGFSISATLLERRRHHVLGQTQRFAQSAHGNLRFGFGYGGRSTRTRHVLDPLVSGLSRLRASRLSADFLTSQLMKLISAISSRMTSCSIRT